ncbi:hypothetical protein H257_02919 [Aphanomyces astaci]|uniref:protein-tyrosine-phosphatase n=1 Tax=Aphanomyces astaci TaxID=112090 RepID=W4H1K2_APHAT|nr:hypothetical protein H257_02919 [Aphanomyces astaci]ETV85038.1 hypothetical protein H257_02919 [Aphanomyces astaci]|eukprot:XP_009825056.1 hypothetical protein H257_02919 [Aphanomyces astaci]
MADTSPTQVLDYVFLGSRQHAKNRAMLESLGITHILNVTPTRKVDPVAGVPNFFEKDNVFTYRRCALFDNQGEDILTSLDGCIAFIDQAKFHGRIFVHCKAGVSRSASIVLAYLMKANAMPFDEALSFLQHKRPMVNPNASFRTQLQAFEKRLVRQSATGRPGTAPSGPSSAAASIGPQLPPHLKRPAACDNVQNDRVDATSMSPKWKKAKVDE